MSNSINRVVIGGHLGADPELRVTQAGVAILKLRLATNAVHYDASNNLVERTDWHDVTLFGTRAEGLARILKKGEAIVVEGTLRSSTYEREGMKIKRVEIVARDVMLSGKRRGNAGPSIASAPAAMPFEEEPYAADGAPLSELATTGEQVVATA
ncbi:MAG: single-stranded DNA-binding protein [Myxococcales bacterium]|nr:single-stranded DNA-binding protein [Myxococcales bacterium]